MLAPDSCIRPELLDVVPPLTEQEMAGFASRTTRVLMGALLFATTTATQLAAQDSTATGRTIIPHDTSNVHKTLFTYRDAILAGTFAGLTIAMFPADRSIANRLQNPEVRANKFFDKSGRGFEAIATPGSFIIGGGLYAYGRLTNHRDLADLGWHGTESVLIASGVTGFLKGALGRSRPYVSADTSPHDFKFGKGFTNADRQSFPSGHTTTAFAAAAAVTSETRRLWPKALPIVAPVMYGGATLVGLSRMYHNNHWASDVVLGAAIGTFSGLKVVRYSHSHPDNKLDRWILNLSASPTPDGAMIGVTLPAP